MLTSNCGWAKCIYDAFQFTILLLSDNEDRSYYFFFFFTRAQLIMAQCDFKGTFLMTRSGKKSASAVLMTFKVNLYSVLIAQPPQSNSGPIHVSPIMFRLEKCFCVMVWCRVKLLSTLLQYHLSKFLHIWEMFSQNEYRMSSIVGRGGGESIEVWWPWLLNSAISKLEICICVFVPLRLCLLAWEAVALTGTPPPRPAERQTLNYTNTRQLVVTCRPSLEMQLVFQN